MSISRLQLAKDITIGLKAIIDSSEEKVMGTLSRRTDSFATAIWFCLNPLGTEP